MSSVSQATYAQIALTEKLANAFSPTGTMPASLTESGQASWTAGSLHDTGTLELTVVADGNVKEKWSFGAISHSLTQDAVGPKRTCHFVDDAANEREFVGPNCLQSLPWFAPWMGANPSAALTAVTDTTTASDTAAGLKRLTFSPVLSQPGDTATIKRLQRDGATTVIYDTKTWLPQRLEYRQTSDADELTFLDVSITFDDYRPESGYIIAHHMKRYVQHTLQLDYVINSVTIQ